MTSPAIPPTCHILLLTHSPLLRGEVRGLLEAGADGGLALRLHVVEARERELAKAMHAVAPRVVLIPLDPGDGQGLDQARELRLIEQLVRGWRVPVLVLGLSRGADAGVAAAAEAACRAAGAVGYLPRERWAAEGGANLRAKIGAASRVKVLRPLEVAPAPARREEPTTNGEAPRPKDTRPLRDGPGALVVIGASAGGPEALRDFLGALPAGLPAPVLIVQHLPPAFGAALALDLGRATPLGVTVAALGEELLPGRVYLAPGRQALSIARGRITDLTYAEVGGVHGQAIDRTMESVAVAYGAGTIGVILSGMGEDGVRGLRAIKARGGLTLGQDEASCQVYGMPRRAAELGLLDRTGPPAALGATIAQLLTAARAATSSVVERREPDAHDRARRAAEVTA